MSSSDETVPKRKQFMLILHNIEKYEDIKAYLIGLKSNNYFIAVQEYSLALGHECIYIYVQFRNAIRLSIHKICGADIFVCKDSPQNID